jgi:hypothetical protein
MTILLRFAVVLGLLSAPAATANAAPIVLADGFETGTLAGWTTTPGFVSLFGVGPVHPHAGEFAAYFGGVNDGLHEDTISQSLATPGQSYVVNFWLTQEGPACDFEHGNFDCLLNDFRVSWNGARILDLVSAAPFGYTEFSLLVQATGPISTLSFVGANEPGFYRLDDVSVSVSEVPEPASLTLLGGGLALLVESRRRCRRRVSRRSRQAPTAHSRLD